MKTKDEIWVCPECGSQEVGETKWVNVNTKEIRLLYGQASDFFCMNCGKYVEELVTLLEWEENTSDIKD